MNSNTFATPKYYNDDTKLYKKREYNTITRLTHINPLNEDDNISNNIHHKKSFSRNTPFFDNNINNQNFQYKSNYTNNESKINKSSHDFRMYNNTNLTTKDYLINLQDKTQELNAHLDELNNIKKINISLEQSIQNMEAESSQLKDDLSIANKRIDCLLDKEVKSNEKITKIKQSYNSLLQENTRLKLEITDLTKEKVELFEKYNLEKESKLEKYSESKISIMQNEIYQLENQLVENEKEYLNKENLLKDKINKITNDFKNEIQLLNQQHQNEIFNLTNQLDTKSNDFNKINDLYMSIDKEFNLYKELSTKKYNELKEEYDIKASRFSLIERKLEETDKSYKETNKKYNDLQIEFDSKVNSLLEEIDNLTNIKDKNLRELNELKAQTDLHKKIQLIASKDRSAFDDASPQKGINTIKMLNSSLSKESKNKLNSNSTSDLNFKQHSPVKSTSIIDTNQNHLISLYESENQKLKDLLNEQQKVITQLNNKILQEKNYFEATLLNLRHSNDDKVDEITCLLKKIKKLHKEILKKEEETIHYKNLIDEYKISFQTEISNKNEEIYQLKIACDKMLAKIYSNMERALYN